MSKLYDRDYQFCDANGVPLASGILEFFVAGTSLGTTAVVYANAERSTSLGNTVNLDAAGRPSSGGSPVDIYGAGNYDVRLRNAAGVAILTIENKRPTSPGSFSGKVSNLEELTALTGMADNDSYEVLGYFEESDGAGGLFFWAASSTAPVVRGMVLASDAGGTGRWVRVYSQPVSAAWFGLYADGSTDDAAGLSAFASWMSSYGGTGIIPPGAYMSSVTIDFNMAPTALAGGVQRAHILGYGVEILNNAAVYSVTLRNTGQMRPCVIEGLTVNHRNNNTALGGFLAEAASNFIFLNCHVQANTTFSSYRGFYTRWEDDTDSTTGTFWGKFEGCTTRELQGADANNIPVGMRIEDNVNALTVLDCHFLSCSSCIDLVANSDSGAYVNGLLVLGCSFEGYTTAINFRSAGQINGARFIGNRFENGTTVFDMDLLDTLPSVPALISGNYYISNAGTILANANSLPVNFQDYGATPNLPGAVFGNDAGYIFRADTAGAGVNLWPVGGGDAGFTIRDNNYTADRVWMRWESGGNGYIGAQTSMRYELSGTTVNIRSGSGSPEGVVTAGVGSLYCRTDGGSGTTLYVKESGTGNTGWSAV